MTRRLQNSKIFYSVVYCTQMTPLTSYLFKINKNYYWWDSEAKRDAGCGVLIRDRFFSFDFNSSIDWYIPTIIYNMKDMGNSMNKTGVEESGTLYKVVGVNPFSEKKKINKTSV